MGVVLYLLLRGRLPFDSKDKEAIMKKTIDARLDLSGAYWSKFTPYVLEFLQKVLVRDPQERLTVEQALEHSWIKNGEILIPRKINRRALDDDLMKKTITTVKMGPTLYSEVPDPDESQDVEQRVIYTTPDIFEDMEVSRRYAEKSLAINLLDSYVPACETEKPLPPEFVAEPLPS
jgi:serine/threonine protein kinase